MHGADMAFFFFFCHGLLYPTQIPKGLCCSLGAVGAGVVVVVVA